MTDLTYTRMPTPVGDLLISTDGQGIRHILFDDGAAAEKLQQRAKQGAHPILQQAETQLAEYFAGTRNAFDLPLSAVGTAFQQRVWNALSTIPFGQTWDYAQLAHAIGQPTAARAVGMANGRNPLSIVVPCHRVIGKNGTLTGYAGGLSRKEWLLKHEGALFAI
ncbi:MAG: methylated-DNA--[protein]-cysteine S-methyltransferase [Natronospirillum sp.]